jgi:hypothetical protein
VDSSNLRPPFDVVKPPVVDDAMQPKEGMDGYPVKVPIIYPTFYICMQMPVGSLQCVPSTFYSIAIMHNNSLTDQIGPEALHDQETEGEVDGRRAWEIPGGTEALWSVMAPHTRYVQPVYQGAHSIDKADIS